MSDLDVIFDGDMISPCACGKGLVRYHKIEFCNDWGKRSCDKSIPVIECEDCKKKYHVETRSSYTRPKEPYDVGWSYTDYLVPNGLSFKKGLCVRWHEMPVDLYIYYTYFEYGNKLPRIIEDFKRAKNANDVLMTESQDILKRCRKELKTQSRKKIIDLLLDIQKNETEYSDRRMAFFDMINDERDKVNDVEKHNNDVVKQSYELHFERAV